MAEQIDEIDALAGRFQWGPLEFDSSPLYQALSPLVADDRSLLELLMSRTPGQQPTNLFFGAVHYLVLSHPEEPLAAYFASVDGDQAQDPALAGPDFLDFCSSHREQLADLIRTRLVQTNVVKRSAALRLALALLRREFDAIHLIEVGSSAGIHLRNDRYGYRIGGLSFGPAETGLTIETEWRSGTPPPDLDNCPDIVTTTGVDLHPIDIRSAADRAWLRALVWPENADEAAQLDAALQVVALNPPRMLEGDAIELCAGLDHQVPAGEPRVVFHAATRAHVPQGRRAQFDESLDQLGQSGPLAVISIEGARTGEPQVPDGLGHLLTIRRPGHEPHYVAHVEGHGDWIAPIA
ncbi:MAG: DUF2332 domain-containing protein [Acidimicrobiales bacterium]